jgi:hypothetical protein
VCDDGNISRAWEIIREIIKASATGSLGYELKQHKPRLDEKYLNFIRSNEAG